MTFTDDWLSILCHGLPSIRTQPLEGFEMYSSGKFFIHERARGLAIFNAGIPAYLALIRDESPAGDKNNGVQRPNHDPRLLKLTWCGPRPSNEEELLDELWDTVDEFRGHGSSMHTPLLTDAEAAHEPVTESKNRTEPPHAKNPDVGEKSLRNPVEKDQARNQK